MSERIIEHPFESGLMLYDTVRDDVHVLNGTARVIYAHAKEGKTPGEIEHALRGRFRIAPDRDVRSDIGKCIALLRKNDLIDPSPPPPAAPP